MVCAHDVDIEAIDLKVQEIITRDFPRPSHADSLKYKELVMHILEKQKANLPQPLTFRQVREAQKQFKYYGKHSFLLEIFDVLKDLGHFQDTDEDLMTLALRIKRGKSHSGINSITILMSPYPEYTDKASGERKKQQFSCKWDCAYCPNDPKAPRSYLSLEPAVLRSIKNEFSVCGQMWDRMNGLYRIGHRKITKLELIVEGGTVTNYPIEYRDEFARDIYYAANTFWDDHTTRRKPWTLDEEKQANQTARSRVIGLTFETRPDEITPEEIKILRRHGCTRVQLGVQHLDDDVLQKIKRRCTTQQVKNAVRMLKDTGFKIDIHLMPNLPGSTVAKDRNMLIDRLLSARFPVPKRSETMFNGIQVSKEEWTLTEPDLSVDQWKLYPCAIVPFTEIEKWYKSGDYIPYGENELANLLIDTQTMMFPWIRVNRLVRDIPADYYHSDTDPSGRLRQEIEKLLHNEGKYCMDIRNREVKGAEWDGKYTLFVRTFQASEGTEYFISAESADQKTLYGFLRLRLAKCPRADVFPELQGCAFIREVHVYGNLQEQDTTSAAATAVQHKGVGKQMMALAEHISRQNKYYKTAVISGEGSKAYYAKLGYVEVDGNYMIKAMN